MKAVIIMGSKSDLDYSKKIAEKVSALAVAKIFALKDEGVREKVVQFQENKRREIYKADEELR